MVSVNGMGPCKDLKRLKLILNSMLTHLGVMFLQILCHDALVSRQQILEGTHKHTVSGHINQGGSVQNT